MLDALAHGLRTLDPERPAVLGATRGGAVRALIRRGEVADLADHYATALHRRGLAAGETLGVAVRPGPRALAVLLAAHRLGLRVVLLDPTAGPDVLTARLAVARPALVVADAAAQAATGWARPLARRAGLALPPLTALGPVVTVGLRLPGCAPALGGATGPLPAPVTGDGDAVIVFTSGTTAPPRAVVHTRATLAACLGAVTELVAPERGSTVVGGTLFVLAPALAAGAAVVLPARRPTALARQLACLAPGHTYLTPPALRAALAAGARFGGRVWTGSAPADAALLRRVKAAGAQEAWGVYALTELFPAAAVEEAEKSAFTAAGHQGDLVGHPLSGVRSDLGADGELLLAGPAACHRYLGEAPGAWVRTGDRATLTDDGGIVLAGRLKDMVLRRAESVYPGLYEPTLHLPGVELAVLVGVPDGHGDERLVALVQPHGGTDPQDLRTALEAPLARMGAARPDAVLLGTVPLSGRSRKPDRRAAAAYCAARLAARPGGR